MVKYCYICKQLGENDKDITIHRLPKNEEIKKKWFEFIGHRVFENCGICSRHFTTFDFTYRKFGLQDKRYLKPGAYPSVLLGIKNTRNIDKFVEMKPNPIVIENIKKFMNDEGNYSDIIKLERDPDDALAVTEDNTDSRISTILGNKVEESITIDETVFVDVKKEIEDDSIYPELNMNLKRDPLEDEAKESIDTDETIINTNSIKIKLERDTDDSLATKKHDIQRNVGDLHREDFTLAVSWCASENVSKRSKTKVKTTPGMQSSTQTIRRRCQKNRIFHCILGKKKALVIQHKEQRMAFALHHLVWKDEWNITIFSNDTIFCMNESDRVRLLGIKRNRYAEKNIQQEYESITLGFWGCMTSLGPGPLVQTTLPMVSEEYIRILSNVMIPYVAETFPGVPVVNFIHGNSEMHQAKVVQKWLATQTNLRTLDLPANSVDLNVMQDLWGIIVQTWDPQFPRTREQLLQHVLTQWEGFRAKPDLFQNLIGSMSQRLNAVIEQNGGVTHYLKSLYEV